MKGLQQAPWCFRGQARTVFKLDTASCLQAYPANDATGSPMAPTSNKFMTVLLLLSGTISMSATEAFTTWEDLATRAADRACGRKALVLQPALPCAHGKAEVMASDMIVETSF